MKIWFSSAKSRAFASADTIPCAADLNALGRCAGDRRMGRSSHRRMVNAHLLPVRLTQLKTNGHFRRADGLPGGGFGSPPNIL
jgi:hypothetical protein